MADGDDDLARFQRVELREVWPHEARDFTPWLAENIAELGQALGLELEVEAQEKQIGQFRLDLLAREVHGCRTVVIENQLDETDSGHLGALLTYAGGCDAQIAVWVAKDFRDEHRQALDWLNRCSSGSTEFFGVAVELWTIDDSRPAPCFRVAAAPDRWRKRGVRTEEPSETELRYREFFESLNRRLQHEGFERSIKTSYPHWFSTPTGHRLGLYYSVSFNYRRNIVRVFLELYMKEAAANKWIFDRISERKDAIEKEFGEFLTWDRTDRYTVSSVAIQRSGRIDDTPQQLEQTANWIIDCMTAFRRCFQPHLDELTPKIPEAFRQDTG